MKFLIRRTSNWGDGKPCDEATKESYVRVDSRSTDDPAKIYGTEGKTDWWYNAGRNHRVENRTIKRDVDDEAWFVELKSLEELVEFYKKHGNLVIQSSWNNPDIIQLEIYDDYRE